MQLKIHKLVNPKFCAMYVPIKGDETKANENDIAFNPI